MLHLNNVTLYSEYTLWSFNFDVRVNALTWIICLLRFTCTNPPIYPASSPLQIDNQFLYACATKTVYNRLALHLQPFHATTQTHKRKRDDVNTNICLTSPKNIGKFFMRFYRRIPAFTYIHGLHLKVKGRYRNLSTEQSDIFS